MHDDVFLLALVDLDNLASLMCLVAIFSFFMVVIIEACVLANSIYF